MIPLVNMLLGEVIFGGLGTGLYSIILVALIGLFAGGLMVGRTPEYLGKQIGPTEMKLISLYTLLGPATILLLTALAVVTDWGTAGLTTNRGPHGSSEIVFAYTSSLANNGQNFAGLSANTPFYNLTTAFAMMVGRFGLALPALALAGHLASQPRRPVGLGTMPTDTLLFARPGDRDDLHCGRPELLPSPRPWGQWSSICCSGCKSLNHWIHPALC